MMARMTTAASHTCSRDTVHASCQGKLPSSRRGMWMQGFMILFFVLILVVAIVLLGIDRGRLSVDRPGVEDEFGDHQASVMLIGMLRQPARVSQSAATGNAAGNAAGGTAVYAPLADIIIMNFDGRYEKDIVAAITAAAPIDRETTVTIEYGDGKKIEVNVEPKAEPSTDVSDAVGHALLPGTKGNTKITMVLE